ncbi:hypothetical protein [Streptomyces sp. NPDC001851]|uniref:hypothetical protein n=1 Tax=Streptomyces sp. NPDC001851 TaxID=3154529 RepID=UPI0033178BDE
MKSFRIGRRLGGAVAAVALASAGALTVATPASAAAYDIAFDNVSLQKSGRLQTQITYSCDVGNDEQLVVNVTKLNTTSHEESVAAGTIKPDKLVCDYNKHTAKLDLRNAPSSLFAKGDKVKVTLFYFDNDGFSYLKQDHLATL